VADVRCPRTVSFARYVNKNVPRRSAPENRPNLIARCSIHIPSTVSLCALPHFAQGLRVCEWSLVSLGRVHCGTTSTRPRLVIGEAHTPPNG
jgi:hypothetical protein